MDKYSLIATLLDKVEQKSSSEHALFVRGGDLPRRRREKVCERARWEGLNI